MMLAMIENTTQLAGELLHNEPLARYTSWRVGGQAKHFYKPAGVEDLQVYLANIAKNEKVVWLGLGSNVLVRDGGIDGSVIYTRGCLNQMEFAAAGELYVEAGVPCAHVAKQSVERGLTGAEFLAGIPGTMGGALAMNAGAFGGETWNLVDSVLLINRQGDLLERKAADFKIGYRSVMLNEDEWFVAATLKIPVGKDKQGRDKIRQLLAKRAQTQPTNLPSGGSVFKNPEGDYAARLIEASELKGYQIGAAQVSEKHANFIVNTGGASAAEIEQLILYVQREVSAQKGILLETEVRIIGEEATI
ncbi:MAG: UDP-N-acetylenolpyruvoylglucosamine reductase [Piscirickettsiaceae bacterium]|nr:MAG: UDP-N-acetylenolpyruvoylglucosamine reductase [Piscirickettsiaceae bacterium]